MTTMVTLRLTVDQFTRLLTIILADETPDYLTDLVLLKCTRPHDGIIAIPVHDDDARAIVAAVRSTSERDLAFADIAVVMAEQLPN
jgi:hypothetical protein